jgi:hypothetical protein
MAGMWVGREERPVAVRSITVEDALRALLDS